MGKSSDDFEGMTILDESFINTITIFALQFDY